LRHFSDRKRIFTLAFEAAPPAVFIFFAAAGFTLLNKAIS
jgi:hypothetical protein